MHVQHLPPRILQVIYLYDAVM